VGVHCTAVDLWEGRLTALSGAEAASSGVTRSDWLILSLAWMCLL